MVTACNKPLRSRVFQITCKSPEITQLKRVILLGTAQYRTVLYNNKLMLLLGTRVIDTSEPKRSVAKLICLHAATETDFMSDSLYAKST